MMTVRGAVKIPVVGVAMAMHHLAYQLANKHAVISINKDFNPGFVRAIKETECYERITSIRSIRKPLKFPMEKMPYTPEELEKEIFEIACKQVEEEEAQLLIIHCTLIFLILSPGAKERLAERLGVIVIDPSAVAVKTTEMIVSLGMSHSKIEYPQIEF